MDICIYPVDICIYPVDICIYPVDICIYPVDICIYPVDICIYPVDICIYPVDICIYPVDICIYPVDICIYPVDICIYPVDICIYPSFDDQFYSDVLPKRHPIFYYVMFLFSKMVTLSDPSSPILNPLCIHTCKGFITTRIFTQYLANIRMCNYVCQPVLTVSVSNVQRFGVPFKALTKQVGLYTYLRK